MPDRLDESLLTSPLEEDDRHSRLRFGFLAGGAVALAIAAVAVWVAVGGSDSDPDADGVVSVAAVASPALVTTSTVPPLVPREVDEQYLYHPTLLPEGFELCAGSLGRPTSGDEFCDPDDPSRWIEVTMLSGRSPSGEPIDGHPSFVLVSDVEPFEVGVQDVGLNVGLTVSGVGVDLDRLVEITASVPLADRDRWTPPEEPPITEPISDEFVRRLLGVGIGELDIRRPPGADVIDVNGPDLNLYTVTTDRDSWRDIRLMAAGLVRPVTVSDERMFVVGGREMNGSVAVWYQRGRYWIVDSDRDRHILTQQVANMESAIAALP